MTTDNASEMNKPANPNVGERSGREPTAPQGPRRRAPHYYAGETYGTYKTGGTYARGVGIAAKGRGKSKAQNRDARKINYPDGQRYANGAIPGVRNKLARRRIRAALGRTFSSIEQKVVKARDLRLEIVGLSDNGHEAHRNFEKTLALHKPVEQPMTRSEARAETRFDRGEHKRALRANFIFIQGQELLSVRNFIASLKALRAD